MIAMTTDHADNLDEAAAEPAVVSDAEKATVTALIETWRSFRDNPDSPEGVAAMSAVVAFMVEHLDGLPLVHHDGLVVVINPLDPASLWCFYPLEV